MTWKRYLAIAGLLAILVAAGFGIAMMIPPAPGVTKANFDRIEIGMTQAEVEAIFGKSGLTVVFPGSLAIQKDVAPKVWKRWTANQLFDREIMEGDFLVMTGSSIAFVGDGVTVKEWDGVEETVIQKLRRWLHI